MSLILPRRSFLAALGAGLVAAPAVVRASSLMALRGEPMRAVAVKYWSDAEGGWRPLEEIQILTAVQAETARPCSTRPGRYWWSAADGAPAGHEVTKSGIVIDNLPKTAVFSA